MVVTPAQEAPSPSASSLRLPLASLGRQSRRNSVNSLASRKPVDKETLNHALDQIHTSASRSETLTTFDEFAPPPPSSSGNDSRSITGDFGGFSGIYGRIKTSFGSAKEALGGSPVGSIDSGKDSSLVATRTISQRQAQANRVSTSTPLASPVLVSATASTLSSPQAAKFPNFQAPSTSQSSRSTSVRTANPPGAQQPPSAPPQKLRLSLNGTEYGSVSLEKSARREDSAGRRVQGSHAESSVEAVGKPSKLTPSEAAGISDSGATQDSSARQASDPTKLGADPTTKRSTKEQDEDEELSSEEEIVIINEDGALRTPRTLAAASLASEEPPQLGDDRAKRSLKVPLDIASTASSTAPVDTTVATPTTVPTRPPLLQVSQSHLPGFRASRASSSDGAPSSNATVVASRPPAPQTVIDTLRMDRAPGTHMQSSQSMSHIKRRVISKEFWMRDENAKVCFYCGDAFNTFRRKHHCRTCGQIFDSKCTSLVPGRSFGQSGSIRVCRSCEVIVNNHDDDSSDYSDDQGYGSLEEEDRFLEKSGTRSSIRDGHVKMSGILSQSDHSKIGTPTISIPMSRKPGDGKRRSAVIEVDSSPTLARPSSSRSLRSLSGRPRSSSHKRHHSKHQHMRNIRYGEFAPFHRYDESDNVRDSKLPAFHNDSIIDPDLADFLSDEGSSEEEQASIFATLSGQQHRQLNTDLDKISHGGAIGALRKAKSRGGDKAGAHGTASRDPDLLSAGNWHANRHSRRNRNLSVGSASQMKLSPRRSKSNALLRNLGANLGGLTATLNTSLGIGSNANGPTIPIHQSLERSLAEKRLSHEGHLPITRRSRPTIELNVASSAHVKRLFKQLLQDAGVTRTSSWEKALMPIMLQCTDEVTPNVQYDDDIDVRHYIKLKKITGSKPAETAYISGVVFSKNVALKSMRRHISRPRIAIVTFAIEYARHQQHFMSLDPVIAQEREYLRNLVNRIAALKPDLLLVQKAVAGLALQFLNEAGIAVAYNVKPSVLNAVARCTKARMISSLDKLAGEKTHLGQCESFDVRTYLTKGAKKTYIYLSGCDPELGCTVVLRGASLDVLRRVKRITEFMCYVIYNLKLENCLMRDEYIDIPLSADTGTLSPGADTALKVAESSQSEPVAPDETLARASYKLQQELEQKPGIGAYSDVKNEDILNIQSEGADANNKEQEADKKPLAPSLNIPENVPMPSFYGDMVEKHNTKLLSASPFVKFMQPYLLMQAREQERRLAYLQRLKDQYRALDEKEEPDGHQEFKLVQPEMIHTIPAKASRQVRDFLHAVHNAEYEKAMHNYQTQKRQWEAYISGNMDLFNPFNHQKIALLYSVVNTHTSTPCIGPEIIALDFYHEHHLDDGFAADCTLGQYVEDLCHGAPSLCDSAGCDRKMLDHHRQYVHGEGQISVFVQKYPSKLSGFQNTILMWSNCRKCEQETPPIPMSDNTWRYSFGKYLELTFWSDPMRPRAGSCTHDIQRDHIRYFGFGNYALRVQYDPIHLYEVIVPRPIVTWKVDSDLKLKNEQYKRIEGRLERFYGSVRARLKGINVESMMPEKVEPCRVEVEKLTKRAIEEQEWCLKKLQDKYMQSRYYEIIPLNRAIRAIVEKAIAWDDTFTNFEREFFPSEKDIRRLAALQLKRLFLERDESRDTLQSVDETSEEASPEGKVDAESEKRAIALSRMPSQMSPEKAHHMLSSVVHQEQSNGQDDSTQHNTSTGDQGSVAEGSQLLNVPTEQPVATPAAETERQEVRHLDLALSNAARNADLESSSPSITRSYSVEPTTPSPPAPPGETTSAPGDEPPKDPVAPSPTVEGNNETKIPRPVDGTARELKVRPALMGRTQSQPGVLETLSSLSSSNGNLTSPMPHKDDVTKPLESPKGFDKRISDRLGMSTFKAAKSMIPRSIPSRRDVTRVSKLAKHFEQLSREFERERMRERRQRDERSRQARNFQLASSKPVVEVYKNVHEAVQERDAPEEDSSTEPPRVSPESSGLTESAVTESTDLTNSTESPVEERNTDHIERSETQQGSPDNRHEDHTEDNNADSGHAGSDVEGEMSDTDRTLLDDIELPSSIEDSQTISPADSSLDLSIDLPKHEKTSLMKMLSSFWSERSASGWTPLEFPFANIEHVWEDSDIIVREDEPSSIIALALSCPDYLSKLEGFRSRPPNADPKVPLTEDKSIELNLLHQANTNIRYYFTNRGVRAQCKIFFAQSFDALRRKTGVADRFVESLSRCLKWDSKGGKSKSIFLRTLDDRFVMKSLSPIEVTAFFRFAPNYFAFTHQNLFKGLPSVIAKMFGLFQVQIKTPTGRDFDWYMLVMENLFYDREPNRRFDLKGSMRNRKIQSTGERDEVLLDENLVDILYSETPIFVREHTKKLLKASVWNDTLFLSKQNVMDYSLMAGFDDANRDIVVGIIDCIRTYTWDKKLETWIKDRGKNKPTITSPKDYRSRFRIAMAKYMLQAPNCWHQFMGQRIERRVLSLERGVGAGNVDDSVGEKRVTSVREGLADDEVDDADAEARMGLSQMGGLDG